MTASAMFSRLATRLEASEKKPFDYIVVDEAQDISIAQLRFLAALAPNKPNSLFFRRRPRPADFSVAIFMESAWH